MKLSLVIIAAMTRAVSAQEYYNLRFEPCEGPVDLGRLSFAVYATQFTDVGRILQTPACRVTLTGVSPGVDPNNVNCMTYKDGTNGGTYLLDGGARKMNVGGTLVSPPFRGIQCSAV
ncbi:hypothetical protein Ptr902_13149 [Pyrenophora tritici-repentis]|uniref:Uncharacterized protein n=1 Tax=Pyrenophora tritici-repentis TaxID=45151 RepID=A0A5M9KKR5_9PLEO|nr:hypothetical protein PtrV1_13405 [Pyrenophora tritici-repentis]KAF7447573.1 hypothetical protein A1F99_090200 [Pyrenophora tritici-repentis]KAF7569953.1 hypothetical protein PtrM4_123680 [Pyrenophora tritici-repentis]KAI0570160.1 hypothetical protein Alg130_11336 [Pyrenophora tritici-repentis]KAI0573972.1 hypothetical protein Alg215_08860 [Pyrenophora tritici-repentis]